MVQLGDLGRVKLGAMSYSSNATIGGSPKVMLAIFQLPGADALALDKAVPAKMEELKLGFPPGIAYEIKYDTRCSSPLRSGRC